MERQHAFQRLKQPCIQLLSVTASLAQSPESRKHLVTALTNLLDTLRTITSKPVALDQKLTEYAFVPISQVLRLSRQVPVRALELCLECISVLLRAGWGGGLEPALAGQFLILFTFLTKPSSAENGIASTSEELQTLALKCMTDLMTDASRTGKGKEAMTSTSNIPALGEAVLVMLDALTDAKSNSTKLQATDALKASLSAITDDDALASFLPRLVSSLTKVLTPSSSNRPGFRVVEQSLDLLSLILKRLLSDRKTNNLPTAVAAEEESDANKVFRTTSWVQATASQIKVALANVFKLRNHDKSEVRRALLRLCLDVVQECRSSLSDCTAMAIETAISLVGRDGEQDMIEIELKTLLVADEQLGYVLRESLHGWVVALPRLMQSKDDQARLQIIHQVSVTLRLFDRDAALIDERLADGLRDSISTVLGDSKGLEELDVHHTKRTDQVILLGSSSTLRFEPLKLRLKGQEVILTEFQLLLHELARSNSAATVLQELIRKIDMGSQEVRLASYWAAVNLLKDMARTNSAFDDFIDMGTPNQREELQDSLYSHSVTMLAQEDLLDVVSWHSYALALETVALQASRYKTEFRGELSEVLYPVLHHMGSSNEALRQHALICLNILSVECGYSNAGELVVANVDYIVNAVGLKLAVGDVSPQVPQVLLMMMRLCGPSLLPYLDDLVGSIFDALERYHGYPKLTELLFSVLKGITEEGVKAPLLAITESDAKQMASHHISPITMADVIAAVKRLDDDALKRKEEDQKDVDIPFPEEPWKSDTAPEAHPQDESEQSNEADTAEPPPPAPRTYDLLLRISSLTQHYLTTPSSALRTSLLSLLRTTIPALAKHENSFLPLINTLWPVLLPRLQDPEAFVVSNALDIVALMCEHAGDFMRTRIEDAWDVFGRIHRRTKQREDRRGGTQSLLTGLDTGMKGLSVSTPSAYRPEMYVDAPTKMIWNSLVGLMCVVVEHVTIRDERFDSVLDMMDPVLEKEEVKRAMERCNADAVWLRLYTKELAKGGTGVAMDRVPEAKLDWHFVCV
ncbi:hypothetical protein HBI32_171380 [Parastagonospora nodorum]|nr:hypothetical protein HBI32_171380 [Parastagonospora nodorum]KAH6110007.1 hypothetical protein HBI69_155900 [Parastagonospora nodorum]